MKTAFLTFAAVLLSAAAAHAGDGAWVSADYAQARLIAGTANRAGLEVRLAPGWHAYWRMPGDGGLPPSFDWAGSTNFESAQVHWPAPERFVDMDLHSFGYKDHFILPLTVARIDEAADTRLDLALALMVCEKICVPQNLTLTLTLPVTGGAHQPRLDAVVLPHEKETDALKIDNMVVGPDAVVARVFAARGFDHVDMFVESGDLYITAAPVITPDKKDPRFAMIRVAAPEGTKSLVKAIGDAPVTLTVTDGTEAIERRFDF